jgi:Mg-chelatase subunit ChlD
MKRAAITFPGPDGSSGIERLKEKTMRLWTATLSAVILAGTAAAQDDKPAIDVVFCIDCSGSMQGIIDTAKRKVWDIVNEIAKARPMPKLRIGMIGYGNADGEQRFFEMTENLDDVYKNLMTFQANMGGAEWVGHVVKTATEKMKWASGKQALKIIFVAGNETAKQGTPELLYNVTVPEAIKAGIMVNAIYCGQPSAEEEATWKEVAKLADGLYTAIDQSGGAVSIETPFDKELAELTSKVNTTYVPYGSKGQEQKENQVAQDANSMANGGYANMASRAQCKNWGGYNCKTWDLVDASKEKDFKLEEVKKEELPKEMQEMTLEEKKAYVEAKAKERDEIQKKVTDLSKKRDTYVGEELKKLGSSQEKAFDEVVRRAVRTQAATRNFQFE